MAVVDGVDEHDETRDRTQGFAWVVLAHTGLQVLAQLLQDTHDLAPGGLPGGWGLLGSSLGAPWGLAEGSLGPLRGFLGAHRGLPRLPGGCLRAP